MPQSDPLNVNESVSSSAQCRCNWECMCVWPVRSCQQNIETHLQANVGHACCVSCQELLQQQPKQKVPTTCCCCQVLFIVFLIPCRSPLPFSTAYACRTLFVLGDFALLCLCCSSSYLRTALRVCVCVFANFISKIVLVPKYPLAQLRVLLYLLLLLLLVLVGLAGHSGTSPASLHQAQELINKVQANAMTVDDVGRQQYRRQPSGKLSSLVPNLTLTCSPRLSPSCNIISH